MVENNNGSVLRCLKEDRCSVDVYMFLISSIHVFVTELDNYMTILSRTASYSPLLSPKDNNCVKDVTFKQTN